MASSPTITDAIAALRNGHTTASRLVEQAISQADALDDALGVFLDRYTDNARAAAKAADERFQNGETVRALEGIPIGIKDIIADSQGPTTAQSRVLDPVWGQRFGDAPVVERLKSAGGIVMGKLTTWEFALGVPDTSKPFPIPRNAWDTERLAGGSSAGSGSGVASEMALGAIGTDTAASIRMPAGFNGITGLMPTFGRVPKSGVVPLSFTLDHVGPMAKSARDCALMLSVIAGADSYDPYSAPAAAEDFIGSLTGDLTGVRVGVDGLDRHVGEHADANVSALFASMGDLLEQAGAAVVPVQLPMYEELVAIDTIVMLSEALAFHRNDLRSRWDDYGQATRVLLASAEVIGGADYTQAMRVRRIAQEKVDSLLQSVDVVATPTGHLPAPRVGAISGLQPTGVMQSLHTPYWNPLGNPTLAIPMGMSTENMPMSMSISGSRWAEGLVLRVGDALQQRSSFHLRRPPALSFAPTD